MSFVQQKKLDDIIVGGHLTISTYLAIRFSIDHPEVVAGTIIFAGQPYSSWPSRRDPTGETPVKLEERAGSIDYFMAPRFYKTVTREQWNDGLYQPSHYSEKSEIGDALYNSTVLVPIPLMVQLLCEYFTTDISLEFEKIEKPVLIIKPGFDEEYLAQNSSHSKLFHSYWQSTESLPNYSMNTIPNARLGLGHTHVKELSIQISQFIQKNFK
jgi:pimeloyl-ACP methyl ester carboxylesterase